MENVVCQLEDVGAQAVEIPVRSGFAGVVDDVDEYWTKVAVVVDDAVDVQLVMVDETAFHVFNAASSAQLVVVRTHRRSICLRKVLQNRFRLVPA